VESSRRNETDLDGWATRVAHLIFHFARDGGTVPDSSTIDDFQQKMLEGATNPEPLHPDLQEFVVRASPDSQLKWDVLKHPIVFGVPYTPVMNFFYNQQFALKMKALQQAFSEQDWHSYVFLHERPHRFEALEAIRPKLTGEAFWNLISSVWSDSENLWQVGPTRIRKLLKLYPGDRHHFMDDRETGFLSRLPDQFRVFRGHQRQNQKGFSWTLSYNKAMWFGRRYQPAGRARISQGVVNKADIVGLVLHRNEMEVVVDPRHMRDLQQMKPIPRPEHIEQLRQGSLKQFRLMGRTDHGADHWDKVDRNGVELCRRVPEADPTVVRMFAIFHDACRQDEMGDPKHGHRAADRVTRLHQEGKIEGITEDQFQKLEFACRHHNGGKPVDDPTIGVCFDSDRLDLIRVGIIPNPKLLSTDAAKGLICMA